MFRNDQKHLGKTIDIHGGGQDLQFPHHEMKPRKVGVRIVHLGALLAV